MIRYRLHKDPMTVKRCIYLIAYQGHEYEIMLRADGEAYARLAGAWVSVGTFASGELTQQKAMSALRSFLNPKHEKDH